MISKKEVVAVVVAAIGMGGWGLYAISSERTELHQQTAKEVSQELWAYQSRPNVDSLSRLAQALDAYAASWYAPDKDSAKALSDALKRSAGAYCASAECKSFSAKGEERKAQERQLEMLKAEQGDAVRKALICTRVFDRDGSDVLMECNDLHAVKRAVLIVSEGVAAKLRPFDTYVADVRDEGIHEVTLNSGFKEYVSYFREVKLDYAGMEKAKAAIQKIDSYVAANEASHEAELQRDMERVAKSADPSLKQIAALFGADYSTPKLTQPATPLPEMNLELEKAAQRQVSDHTVAGVLFHIDSDSPANFTGTWTSKIQAEGKDVVVTNELVSFEKAVDANNGGLLVFSESGGGKSCDAFPFKAVLISKGKVARTTPVLGYCDTTFKVSGDEIRSESKQAGINCRIEVGKGEVDCQAKSG